MWSVTNEAQLQIGQQDVPTSQYRQQLQGSAQKKKSQITGTH